MKKRLGALLLAASMVVSTVALGGCSSGKPAETKAQPLRQLRLQGMARKLTLRRLRRLRLPRAAKMRQIIRLC